MPPQELAEIRARLDALVAYRQTHLRGDERGEAQIFLERLFQAFGHAGIREAGASLEDRVRVGPEGRVSFADLMWKPHCLIEMKKAGSDLRRHYQQAFTYWVHAVPDRPRYVVLCNFDELWIYDFDHQLDEPLDRVPLADLARRWEALAFLAPTPIEPIFSNDLVAVTRQSADRMAAVFRSITDRGIERHKAQRFILQCVMAAFSEDIGLLPSHSFTNAIRDSLDQGSAFDLLFGLFREMDTPGVTEGGRFAGTPFFNGGLFAIVEAFELERLEIELLNNAVETDWSAVRPEIFGTLFEQSMDAGERHALGAHFTSPVDIAKVIQPTIVAPWRQELEDLRTTNIANLERLLWRLTQFRVLDPACGAGNFLYVAYRELKRLERDINEAINDLRRAGRRDESHLSIIGTHQFYGIDVNTFAVELAKVTLLLAKKLSVDELGLAHEQVLPLDNLDANFSASDALFMRWPAVEAIVGNPPYLGRRKLAEERGRSYVAELDAAYPGVGGVADYVVYWFQRSHDHLPEGGRAGLVATNTIRQGDSRVASLDYIVDSGGTITDAISTQPWSGDAQVSVSIVNWIKGSGVPPFNLWLGDGHLLLQTDRISPALSSEIDLRRAKAIEANKTPKACFQGQTPGSDAFYVSSEEAAELAEANMAQTALHPTVGGMQLLHSLEVERWIIDIPQDDISVATALYPRALARLRETVLPLREEKAIRERIGNDEVRQRNPRARVNQHHQRFLEHWWKLAYRRADLIERLGSLDRYIAVARTSSEERLTVFEFVNSQVYPGDSIVAFTFSDDYTFGVLQSSLHRAWFEERCTTLETRLTYTEKTVWDCFPWPQDPSVAGVEGVVSAVSEIQGVRALLRGEGLSLAAMYDTLRTPGASALRQAHERLDAAVMDAYGFDDSDDPLAQLLALNLDVVAAEEHWEVVRGPGGQDLPGSRVTNYCWGS